MQRKRMMESQGHGGLEKKEEKDKMEMVKKNGSEIP